VAYTGAYMTIQFVYQAFLRLEKTDEAAQGRHPDLN